MKQVKEFFDKHPGCDEVHEALGYLFTDKEAAEKMLGGVSGEEVESYGRGDFSEAPAPIINQVGDTDVADEEVTQALEQDAEPRPIIHNDATTYGKSAEEVAAIEQEEKNQKPKKESADKAKAKSKPKGK